MDKAEELENRYSELYWADYSPEKEKQLLQIVKEAQKINNLDIEIDARLEYISTVTHLNKPEKTLAYFPWILAMSDKHPDKVSLSRVLWQYKWVASRLGEFSHISKDKILGIMEDMKRRYVAAGYGMKTIHYFFQDLYCDLGEPELAAEHHELWKTTTGNSSISDCEACVTNTMLEYELWKGNYQACIDMAEPILAKKLTCATVPEMTYSKVISAQINLNQLEEALNLYKTAIKELETDRANLDHYGRFIILLSLTENHVAAKELFIKQLPYAIAAQCDFYTIQFYIGVLFFLKTLQQDGHQEFVLPEALTLPVANTENNYQVSELIPYFEKEVDKIADAFNHRNENEFYSSIKLDALSLMKFKRKISL